MQAVTAKLIADAQAKPPMPDHPMHPTFLREDMPAKLSNEKWVLLVGSLVADMFSLGWCHLPVRCLVSQYFTSGGLLSLILQERGRASRR